MVSQPLTKLTGKEPWQWGNEQITTFTKLKELATLQPVLNLFEFGCPTEVKMDASTYGMGAVLSQKMDDDIWRPIAFISKAFNPTKYNYPIYDQELYAIIYALQQWCHFLLNEPFKVVTDHQNLTYFKTP